MEFNPNKAPALSVYATYCPGRRPNFKTHKTIGHAKNAINASLDGIGRGGILYEWDGGEWREIDRREVNLCDDCGKDMSPGFMHRRRLSVVVTPAYKAPIVCRTCYDSKYDWDIKNKVENVQEILERLGLNGN